MKPTRTLFINLYTDMGGGEFGLYHLLEHLDRSQIEPILLVNGRGALPERVERLGIEVILLPFDVVTLKRLFTSGALGRNFRAGLQLRRLIRERKIEAVVCSDVLALLLLLPSCLTRSLKVFYNMIFFYETPRMLLFNLLAPMFVDHIALLSTAMRADLARRSVGLAQKASVIHWGVDRKRFYPRTAGERKVLRARLGLPAERALVGMVGRYEVWKGHLPFLDAAEKLVGSHPEVVVLLVGGAMTGPIIPEVAAYQARVRERIASFQPRESLLVWDHRDDIPEIMSCLDLAVCPSDREPYGLVVLEALASGVPVVATTSVGVLELFGKENLLFTAEPGSSTSIFLAMETALSSPIGRDDRVKSVKTIVNWPDWRNYSALVEAKIGT